MKIACAFACLPLLCGCARTENKKASAPETQASAPVTYFKVDPGTAATIGGNVRFTGRKPAARIIDMDQDPECARLHKNGRMIDDAVTVSANGGLANVLVYVQSGLEGRKFEPAATPVTIDQNGCWFRPRVLGIQAGQPLNVTNSDPVTHNIHPIAQVNREWNQSQASGDPPLKRRFARPEIMIPVKCNIHRWMHAYIGVVDHPYYAVTGSDGTFAIPNLPPGTYTIAAWQETLGKQEQSVTLSPSGKAAVNFTFKGE